MSANVAKKDSSPVNTPGSKANSARTGASSNALFGKENFTWMLAGLVVMAIGFFLMAGGKNENPNVFDDTVTYSFTRITLAPILIVGGLVIEIFAIMRKPKKQA
jgi:hypothetical protein